jgi:thioredoxin reductase
MKIKKKYEQYLQDLWDTSERPNLQIVGIPIRKKYRKHNRRNFPNFEKGIHVQETYRHKRQDQETSPKHITVKILNVQKKKRILKVAGEKHQVTYKGKFITITADFSIETKNQEGTE